MKTHPQKHPYAYFITFTTFGTWLHGSDKGSIDTFHSKYGGPKRKPNIELCGYMKSESKSLPVFLNEKQRDVVLQATKLACQHYRWHLLAMHVRTNHVHIVVQASQCPEKIMTQLKAYASRALNKLYKRTLAGKYWSRHGSTRYVWSSKFLFPVIHYVIDEQGGRMTCYYEDWYDPNWRK